MKLVASNSAEDIERAMARERFVWALKNLFGRLAQHAAGGRDPGSLIESMKEVERARVGMIHGFDGCEIGDALDTDYDRERHRAWREEALDEGRELDVEKSEALEEVVKFAVRLVAHRALGNATQQRLAESELARAIRRKERAVYLRCIQDGVYPASLREINEAWQRRARRP